MAISALLRTVDCGSGQNGAGVGANGPPGSRLDYAHNSRHGGQELVSEGDLEFYRPKK